VPDSIKLRASIWDLIGEMGIDLKDPEFAETPRRAAEWFMSFARKPDYDGEDQKFLSVQFPSTHGELIWESNLHFVSLCPHHLLPYSGIAAIGYIPKDGVVGISKLARALEYWTHYPVKQEDATTQLADALMQYIQPRGCMVVLRAHHTCMGERGVNQRVHSTGTSAVRGCFSQNQDSCRDEFLRLANP